MTRNNFVRDGSTNPAVSLNTPPLHIHFLGAPGMGKSALAAMVYAEMKVRGVRVELVQEVAKELLWEGRLIAERQMLTTAEQMNREDRLRQHADVIVSESPALLGVVYAVPSQKEALRQAVLSVTKDWETISFLVERDITKNYERFGRLENPQESMGKGREIRELLGQCRTPFKNLVMENDPATLWPTAKKICDEVGAQYGYGTKQRRPLIAGAGSERALREMGG